MASPDGKPATGCGAGALETPTIDPASDLLEDLLQLASIDFDRGVEALRAAASASGAPDALLSRQMETLLDASRYDELAVLVYLIADAISVDKATSFAEQASLQPGAGDPLIVAFADMYHRAARYTQALALVEQRLSAASSDALVVKFADYARDVGKSFRGEAILRRFLRGGRWSLLSRLAEHYLESRNWLALRGLLATVPRDELNDYMLYLLGRAQVALLDEAAVIGCADRLWSLAFPGPRYGQLLIDVWRWRIGDVERSLPESDPSGLPYFLAADARMVGQPTAFELDESTLVRSACGWRTLRPRENLPNVLGIGTQRTATTWLWFHLSQHPDIQPMPGKEAVFFSDAFASPRDVDPAWASRIPEEVDTYWEGPTRNLFRYLRMFGAGYPVRADFSPSYAELPEESVAVIRDLLGPDLRILLCVRDPVERSWSNLKYDMKLAGVNFRGLSFAERVEHYQSDISFRRSDYGAMLGRWRRYFANMHVMFYDDVLARPAALLEEVANFVGLSPDALPMHAERINESIDDAVPQADRRFLLGLHHTHYDEAEALLGGPATSWRPQQLLLCDPADVTQPTPASRFRFKGLGRPW